MKLFYPLSPILSFLFLSGLQAQSPTWSGEIGCLIYTHCTTCHHDGGIAPFSLTSYDEAYSYRYQIQAYVNAGLMPPWPPEDGAYTIANDRSLTADEIALIDAWVDADAPEGDPAEAPAAPEISSEEVIADPDLVLQLPTYTSQAVDEDDYRCFIIENPETTTRYIKSIEIVPGNPAIVHHLLLYADGSGTPALLDNLDPGPGYVCFGGIGSNSATLLGGWAPGAQPVTLPENMGIQVFPGQDFVIQLHYPEGSAGEVDHTKINIKYSDEPSPRLVQFSPILNHFTTLVDGPLFIPANTVKTFHEEYTIGGQISILGVAPHMHLIGESIHTWAELPSNQIISMLDIPEWDFEWQGIYQYRNPIILPFGSTLKAEAVYNNTTSNPNNPSNPPQNVSLGEATTDEMMIVFFLWTAYQSGDEMLEFPDKPLLDVPDCSAITAVSEIQEGHQLTIFPNPAQDRLHLRIDSEEEMSVRMLTPAGLTVAAQHELRGRAELDTSLLPAGIYLVEVQVGKEVLNRKVVIAP